MITIEQLLESVDLEFEPRFVTKDESGVITIYSHRPIPEDCGNEWRESEGDYDTFGELKLAEFENKDWKKCIYEVPRKATGKIERFTLEDFVCISDIEDYIRNVLDGRAFNKLNALVDTVNELKGE